MADPLPTVPKAKWVAAQQAKLISMVSTPWTPGPNDVPQESFKAALMMMGSLLPGQRGNIVASSINLIMTYLISPNAQTRKDAEYTAMIQKLVNPAVATYDSATIAAQLRGCQMQFESFYDHLDSLAKTPTSEIKKTLVRIAYQALENDLSCTYIFLAQKAGSELDTLDEFAVFATLHLIILREAILQRKTWGFPDSTIGNYIEKFDKCIVQYRAYIDKWYNYGYNQVKTPITADKYPFMTFNRINYYRTSMTLYVYDFVNMWWTLDTRIFPRAGVSFERVRTAMIRYDLLPKSIIFYRDQAATIEDSRISTPNTLPSVSGIEDIYIKAYGPKVVKFGYPCNKVGSIIGMDYNNDITLSYITSNLPILDSIAIGFIGEEVFSENLIFSKMATIIDAQKYKTSSDDTNVTEDKTVFVRDANGLSQHGITLISPGSLTYELDFEDAAILKYKVSVMVSSCTVLGLLQLTNSVGASVGATLPVPVGTMPKVFDFIAPVTFAGAANQNYTINFTGSCVITSIVFTPYPLAWAIPAFPPNNAITPTTPNNPASYTDKKQWMAVQQANTNYSVLTLKEFVPPDVYNPWNYYKIMICCALNFVPTYGPILAGVTDIFLSFIIDYNSEDNTMARYRKMLNDLVDTNITLYDNAVIKAQYAGCAQSYHNFMLCLANFNNAPIDTPAAEMVRIKELVRITFQNLENDIGCKYIYTARKVGNQVEELMMFGLFATSHLTLLREVMMNGEKWGFDPKTVTIYRKKFYKHIIEYRDYAIVTYEKGYAAISAKTVLNVGFLYNNLNEYRNMMITSVFDMVNIWFMFDPAIYANVGITHERVRYLFSKIYGTACSQTLPEIEALVAQYGYHQYQGDLTKVASAQDQLSAKFSMVYPTFTKAGKSVNGTILSNYSTSLSVVTGEAHINPTLPVTSVKVRYDYFPRQLDFIASGGPTTSISSYDLSYSKWVFNNSYTNAEMDWYNVYFYNNLRESGGLVNTSSEADHKLGNCFQLSTNNNANVMDLQNKSSRGFADGLILAWLPTEVFTDNFIEDSMITMVDAQKYSAKSANTTFAKDFFMPGVHAMTLAPTAWIEFVFKPRVATAIDFTVMLRFDCDKGSNCLMVNKDKAAESVSFGLPVNDRAVFIPAVLKNVKLDKADGNNHYRITNNGSNPFTLQSILFRPKDK
eukprot:gene1351-1545_t